MAFGLTGQLWCMYAGPAPNNRPTIGRNDTAASENGLTGAIIHEMANQTIL